MTIDPPTIPCAYCGEFSKLSNLPYWITCSECYSVIQPQNWITGGINALAGKLMRQDIFICKTYKGWTWDKISEDEDEDASGGMFPSFEECVLDAWEYLKKKEEAKP